MDHIALILVLTSALIHATWNLLAKKSNGGAEFVWLFSSLSSLFLIPAASVYLVLVVGAISGMGILFIFGTTVLHLAYFICLQRGYRYGDLSLVYPLARGLGPTLATVGAVVLLAERPSALALCGLGLVMVGVILLTVRRSDGAIKRPRLGIFYGALTGTVIAIYTVWDKYAISEVNVPPLVLEAFTGLGISICLTPHAIRNWSQVKTQWNANRLPVVGVAILAPASYILILTAMSFTPLSYVAPAREISILFATMMGTRFLGEGNTVSRIAAACSMVCGIVALTIG